MKIGILGGSFNPPHNGHLYLGRRFRELLELDRVLVIPAGIPPHKAEKKLAPDADRLAMCRMMFRDSFFTVSDMELRRQGKSYTVDTLAELKRQYPGDELFLLVGADMLLYFDKWYRWQEILQMCTLCAFARDGEHDAAELERYARETLKSGRVKIADVPAFPASSTQIREALCRGEPVQELLPGDVIAYIQKKGLYDAK